MSQELKKGKYEFYPYEFDKSNNPTLDDLKEWLKKAKTDNKIRTIWHSTPVIKRGPKAK